MKGIDDFRTQGTRPNMGDDAGDKGKGKDKTPNPFTRAGWSLAEQGRLIKTLGIEKTAAIARAAGVKIGATRPVM